MLNNPQIIEGMTDEQKLALVADVFAVTDASTGLPHVECREIDELSREDNATGIGFFGLNFSWNPKLFEVIASDTVKREGTEKYSLLYTPPVNVRANPYASGCVEDPYLATQYAGACVSAMENAGAAACVDKCGLRPIDVEFLDAKPDKAAISNVMTRSVEAIIRSGKPSAARIACTKLRGDYQSINTDIMESTLKKNSAKTVLATDVFEDALRGRLATPKLVFSGAPLGALRSALKNYRRLKEDVERGSVTVGEMESAIEAGTAISDETLNEAVDKAISFLTASKRQRTVTTFADDKEKTLYRTQLLKRTVFAVAESTVLLKNENVLPLEGGQKVAVVGELADMFGNIDAIAGRVCSSRKASYLGRARGYGIEEERSDGLLTEAVKLAQGADTVVVFLGLGPRREKRMAELKSVALPANQSALVDALVKTGKKVIAVVTGCYLPDMAFDAKVPAVLYLPTNGALGAEALFDILFAVMSPSGRLAVSAYDNTDELFSRQKQAVAAGRYKVGEFIGYRRYVSEKAPVKYPFGHGLSYGKFEYTDIKVANNNVEVTIKNTGARSTQEVVQMYIGKPDSAIVRPTMELKGFAKLMVAPGSSTQVKFPINPVMLEVFDPEDGRRKTENGKYTVYIGSSSKDIKKTAEINVAGVAIKKTSEKLSDYLPTLTNIVSGGYKMNKVAGEEEPEEKVTMAREGESFSYERLFEEEFVKPADDGDEQVSERDVFDFLDDSVTVKTVAQALSEFSRDRGYKLENDVAREIVSAFAASRVILTRGDGGAFAELVRVLCEFFGCPLGIDNAEGYSSSDHLFSYGTDTYLTRAVAFGCAHRETVTVAALDNVTPNKLGTVFAPFIRYAGAPSDITINVGAAKRKFNVAPNMWFIMRLAPGKSVMPAYIADMASVIYPEGTKLAPNGNTLSHAPNCYQLVAACEKAERSYEIAEELWQKADRLEEFVNKFTPFRMDNKMCVQMERFIGAFLGCGGEGAAALDSALAAKIVPYVLTALDGKMGEADTDIDQAIESIFGEDDSSAMRRAVRLAKL